MTLPFPVNPRDMLKKSLAAPMFITLNPIIKDLKTIKKEKLFIIQMVFAFQWWQYKSLILTHKFRAFSHVLFSSRQCLLTANLNLVSFQPFLASWRNSLSIESQKPVSAFFRSSISLMLAMSKLNSGLARNGERWHARLRTHLKLF